VLTKDIEKDGNVIPVVKNHIDLADTVLRSLEQDYRSKQNCSDNWSVAAFCSAKSKQIREGRGATDGS